jgi:nucleotide-binding universal stress UspA family protein
MYKVLVPFDFSHFAINALKTAINLSKKQELKIHVLQVIDGISVFNDSIEKFKELSKEENLGKISFEIHLENSKEVIKTIEEKAIQIDCDLIIMGSKGFGNSILKTGSHTADLLKITTHPVLIIKEQIMSEQIGRLLIPSNFRGEFVEKIDIVNEACMMLMPQTTQLLKINTAKDFEKSEISEGYMMPVAEALPSERVELTIWNAESVLSGIDYFVDRTKPDVVLMGTHKRATMDRLISNNLAFKLIGKSVTPVYVFNFAHHKLYDDSKFALD